jgi:peroxiredoxin
MKTALLIAAVYNIVWGLVVIAAPEWTLRLLGLSEPAAYPQIWQCVGMIVGVYGIGYGIAAFNPYRHWPIVLVGLLGKVFGPIGFLVNILTGELPLSMGWTLLTNDLIWWVPFGMILWGAFRAHLAVGSVHVEDFLDDDPVRELMASTGQSLYQLSLNKPQLTVFLRHTGCTFCREALADLQKNRQEIESLGVGIVLVHLGDDEQSLGILGRYGLADLPRISDPSCRLYRQFGLDLGSFQQLFGMQTWIRGLKVGFIDGHGIGSVSGNPLQMPGAFVVQCGRILDGYHHDVASDRPDYLALVHGAVDLLEEPAMA